MIGCLIAADGQNRRTSRRGAAAEVFFGTRGPCAGLRAQIPVHARSLSAANAGRNVKWPRQGEIVSSASGAPAPQGPGPPAQASSDTSLAPSSFLYLRPLGKMCLHRISIAAAADAMLCPAPAYAHVQPLMCDAVPALLQCSEGHRNYSPCWKPLMACLPHPVALANLLQHAGGSGGSSTVPRRRRQRRHPPARGDQGDQRAAAGCPNRICELPTN